MHCPLSQGEFQIGNALTEGFFIELNGDFYFE